MDVHLDQSRDFHFVFRLLNNTYSATVRATLDLEDDDLVKAGEEEVPRWRNIKMDQAMWS